MPSHATAAGTADLMLLLSQASHVLETELTAGLSTVGISPRAYCVLSKAIAADLTQNRLAEMCSLDKTTMVVLIDELERDGLAERRALSTDRRARIIAVTPYGEHLLAKAEAVVTRIYDDVLGSLAGNERTSFVAALERLVEGRLSTPVHCERPVRRRFG